MCFYSCLLLEDALHLFDICHTYALDSLQASASQKPDIFSPHAQKTLNPLLQLIS